MTSGSPDQHLPGGIASSTSGRPRRVRAQSCLWLYDAAASLTVVAALAVGGLPVLTHTATARAQDKSTLVAHSVTHEATLRETVVTAQTTRPAVAAPPAPLEATSRKGMPWTLEQQSDSPSSGVPQHGSQGGLGRIGSKVKQELERTEGVAARFARYVRNAAKMRTFHDSATLEDSAVIDVLRRHRVGRGEKQPSGPRPGVEAGHEERFPVSTYTGGLSWPLEAGIVSSEFGPRWGKFHSGIDIAADVGQPVHATAPGVVIYAGHGMSGYGNVVIVRHDTDLTSLYAHNSRLEVHEGDSVKQGTVIARLGSTGHSTGPHLHFEIRQGEKPINPRQRLPSNKYIGK
jgi:murein DD-endopeptidase MepM/ murein hydrolase activator NlpD